MVKIKRNWFILIILLVITLITASGCAKPECYTGTDCSSKTCYASRCESGKCAYTIQQNCCGNKLKEATESGKPGSQCTCPEDYGKCEGKTKIKIGSRTEDASYVHYYCSVDNQCVLGVEKNDVVPQNFLDVINPGFFKASSIEKYNKPFDVGKDSFEFKISLDDAGRDLILPVRLTNIKLLYGTEYTRAELLIAEKDIDGVLNGVGDQDTIKVPLTLNYKPREAEEAGSIRYSIDYEYTKKVAGGKSANGTNIYTSEIVRATFTSPSKPIFFVRSG